MKDTKVLSRSGFVPTILGLVIIIILLGGCDVLESDPDVIQPGVKVDNNVLFVMANGATIFYLPDRVQSNQDVRVDVTGSPKLGTLSSLGNGIVKYSPSDPNRKGQDGFEVSIFTLNNRLLKKDSVYITIENDSSQLPCSIYAVEDRVFNAKIDSTITIDVTANDIICNKMALNVSVWQAAGNTRPRYGQASVENNKIIYKPGKSFPGYDTIVYLVHGVNDLATTSIGIVSVSSATSCQLIPRNDSYELDTLQSSTILLPVFRNDSLCDEIGRYNITIKTNPILGTATVAPLGISYRTPSTKTSALDSFTYQICEGSTCKTAKVMLTVNTGEVSQCTFQAVADTLDLSGNTIPLMYLNVLYNDQLCDSLKTLEITQSPKYGSATINTPDNTISYSRVQFLNDSLEYKICSSVSCSKAKVYIKQQ